MAVIQALMEKYEWGTNIEAKSIFYHVAEQVFNYWTFPDVNIGKQMDSNKYINIVIFI